MLVVAASLAGGVLTEVLVLAASLAGGVLAGGVLAGGVLTEVLASLSRSICLTLEWCCDALRYFSAF